MVIPAPKEEILGRIVVEWDGSLERTHYQQSNGLIRIKDPGIGGCYHPAAFPLVGIHLHNVLHGFLVPLSIGDRVCINPTKMGELKLKLEKTNRGNYVDRFLKV